MVSPRMNAVPSFRLSSLFSCSSASSRTVLMWMSKALSLPTYCLPFLRSTMTRFPLLLFNASNGLSDSPMVDCPPLRCVLRVGVYKSCVFAFSQSQAF